MLEEYTIDYTPKEKITPLAFKKCIHGYYNGLGKKDIIEKVYPDLEKYFPEGSYNDMSDSYLRTLARLSSFMILNQDIKEEEGRIVRELTNGLKVCAENRKSFTERLFGIS